MKQKFSQFASRLSVLALAILVVFSVTSCNSDDDDDSSNASVVGTWVNGTASYRFTNNGTGMYDSGRDVSGDFTYTDSHGSVVGTVYIKITYTNSKVHSVWRDELVGEYNLKEGKI